jgi:hypothetical protein
MTPSICQQLSGGVDLDGQVPPPPGGTRIAGFGPSSPSGPPGPDRPGGRRLF